MTPAELIKLTGAIRRAFPRHGDILALCDEAEKLVTLHSKPVTLQCPKCEALAKKNRDRVKRHRELSRNLGNLGKEIKHYK